MCKVSGPACSRGAHELQSAVPGCGIQTQGLDPRRNTLCEEEEELPTELCYLLMVDVFCPSPVGVWLVLSPLWTFL